MNNIFDVFDKKYIETDCGSFKFMCSIVSRDYPKCFICEKNNSYFAFLEIEDDDDFFGWNVTCVSEEDINLVNTGEKSVQSLFRDKKCYQLIFKDHINIGHFDEVDSFSGKYEILGDYFHPSFCDMDVIFDYHRIYKFAHEKKRNSLSVVLEKQDMCTTDVILKIISYIKSMCSNLDNSLNLLKTKFAVNHQSTVITFTFPENEGPLLEENIAPIGTEGINELGNILSTDNADILSSITSKRKIAILSKYEKLIDVCSTSDNLRPKIVIGCSQKDHAISYSMQKQNTRAKRKAVKVAISSIKGKVLPIKEQVTCKGILTAIATATENSFTFRDTVNDVTYKGIVDFSMIGVDSFDVNGTIYEAQIESIKSYLDGNILKASHKLLSLKPIRKIEQLKDGNIFENK